MNLFIFDLDGVIYKGNTIIEGVKETLQALREREEKICFLSNNSTLSRKGQCERLRGWGLSITQEQLFTSSYLCTLYLKKYKRISSDEKVMVVGERGIFEELKAQNINTCEDPDKVSYVVVGMDRKLTFHKLSRAHQAIIKGAEFIATNTDMTYPLEKNTIPGSGAIVRALEASTKTAPVDLGKPHPFGLKIVLEQTGFSSENSIFVGDRLETDIAAGNKLGLTTVLVLSGISSRQDLEKAPPHCQPRHVIGCLPQLTNLKFS